MDQPHIAGKAPVEAAVEAGREYWWCACGRSQNQPWCDGSHAGTGHEPVAYTAKRDRSLWFCTCKQTKTGPFCDGSHNHL